MEEDNNNDQQSNQIEEKQIDKKQTEEIENLIAKDASIDTDKIQTYAKTQKIKTKRRCRS